MLLEDGLCYDQFILLAKLLPLPCFILYYKAKLACYSRYLLTSYFYIPISYDEKDIFFDVSLEGPVGLHRTNTQKRCPFRIGDWNAKAGSQEIAGVTGKFGLGVQNEAAQRLRVLPREHTGHGKHPLPTTQEKTLHMDITRWSI